MRGFSFVGYRQVGVYGNSTKMGIAEHAHEAALPDPLYSEPWTGTPPDGVRDGLAFCSCLTTFPSFLLVLLHSLPELNFFQDVDL